MQYKNFTRTYDLTSLEPYINLNNFRSFLSNISVEVLTPVHEKPYIPSNILYDNGKFYYVNAAPKGFANSKTIGDFQIALRKNLSLNTMDYNIEDIDCLGQSCGIYCVGPQPTLRKLRSRVQKGYEKSIKLYSYAEKNVITKVQTSASVQLKVGNININKLHLIQPKCQINLVYKSACYGCNTKPYLLFQASQIIQEGAVEFQSNCTFSHNYLSCNVEKFKLEYKFFETYCYLYIDEFNKTIYVENLEKFEGAIEFQQPLHSSPSSSIMENMRDLTQSETFITTIMSTISCIFTLSAFGFIARILLKIYEIRSANKQANII